MDNGSVSGSRLGAETSASESWETRKFRAVYLVAGILPGAEWKTGIDGYLCVNIKSEYTM